MSWYEQAACKDADTSLFFAERGQNRQVAEAKAICAACPVVHDCLTEALKIADMPGVWGGLTFEQRKRLRAGMSYVVVACHACGDQFPVPTKVGRKAEFCKRCGGKRRREQNRRQTRGWRERQAS